MTENCATFRFYGELNDFLPVSKRHRMFERCFNGHPAVKDAVEALGVPHVEVDLLLVNGLSVGFDYRLQAGDYVSVYPVFETLDISTVTHLRPIPLRRPAFILDVHLGKLVKYLRMLGFDTLYRNDYSDPEIIRIATSEHRIILTRDVGLLKVKAVTHGYWLRSQHAGEQLAEVLQHFDLYSRIDPFNRCVKCNGMLEEVPKESVLSQLEPLTRQCFDVFYRCRGCRTVFWEGTHYERMKEFVESIRNAKP